MTATCHTLPSERYVLAVAAEIERMARVVRGADMTARVPGCPDWSLGELLTHTGGVHRWASAMVSELSQERMSFKDVDFGFPDDPSGLADWLAAGRDILVPALAKHDPDAAMWAWGSDPHVRFWPRRQLHETVVHRADAEAALGLPISIDADVAVDGIDEFLDNLPNAVYFAPKVADLRGDGEKLVFGCPEAAWCITFAPDGFTWAHDASDGDAGVAAGSASDLLRLFYGRIGADAFDVTGDTDVLARWLDNSSL